MNMCERTDICERLCVNDASVKCAKYSEFTDKGNLDNLICLTSSANNKSTIS